MGTTGSDVLTGLTTVSEYVTESFADRLVPKLLPEMVTSSCPVVLPLLAPGPEKYAMDGAAYEVELYMGLTWLTIFTNHFKLPPVPAAVKQLICDEVDESAITVHDCAMYSTPE